MLTFANCPLPNVREKLAMAIARALYEPDERVFIPKERYYHTWWKIPFIPLEMKVSHRDPHDGYTVKFKTDFGTLTTCPYRYYDDVTGEIIENPYTI